MANLFSKLPSVDAVLDALAADASLASLPRPLLREQVNAFLDVCREEIRDGVLTDPAQVGLAPLLPRLRAFVRVGVRPRFRRVLNATGVVVHTNLGRSLLCADAIRAVVEADARYSNLEFNLGTGQRGSRYSHVEELLCALTGAEAALVVNNNAAAVMLVLETLAKGREVIVSRGQLVEIGGSFRIPEVMAKSGATLREVGATNRTHLRDYEQAICDQTAALMKVHTSNFRIVGFTKEVALPELVALGRRFNLPVIEDLGSGNFFDFSALGLGHEPTVQQVVADGADVVSFSGDKVLGGPQAGVIVGRKEYIDRIKVNPMNRALRIDKMTLAALEATLRLYRDPELARREVPTLRMITAAPDDLKRQARRLAGRIRKALGDRARVALVPGESQVGGGAFPERGLPTTLVRVDAAGLGPDALRERLLATDPPLVGRIEDNGFCLDPRTLAVDEHGLAAAVLAAALA
ncbi:MAG: L-seryl-tRNA(Sec) selenium transferase [Desulfovibrionaceae bacterium]